MGLYSRKWKTLEQRRHDEAIDTIIKRRHIINQTQEAYTFGKAQILYLPFDTLSQRAVPHKNEIYMTINLGEPGKCINKETMILHQLKSTDVTHKPVLLRKVIRGPERGTTRDIKSKSPDINAIVYHSELLVRIHKLARCLRTG